MTAIKCRNYEPVEIEIAKTHAIFATGEPQIAWMLGVGKRQPADYYKLRELDITVMFLFDVACQIGYMTRNKGWLYELTDEAWDILDKLNEEVSK